MRPPRRLALPPRVAAAFVLALVAVSACSAIDSTSDADLGDLLVLAGDPGDAGLETWAKGAAPEDATAVVTPKGTAWVASGRSAVLAAGLVGGGLRISDPIDPPDEATWRKVKAAGADGDAAEGPFYFPTWDPEGGRFAALAGDLDAEPRLTLVDPSVGGAFEIALERPVAAAPPAWVGTDLVAIAVGDASEPGSILVDTTTGEIRDGPAGGRLFATSGDAATIAVVGPDGDTVTIRTTAGWLSGDGSSMGSVDAPPSAVAPTALALDGDGQRLAVAWLDDDGGVSVAVHERAAGWQRAAQLDQGKVAGAVVAWLR